MDENIRMTRQVLKLLIAFCASIPLSSFAETSLGFEVGPGLAIIDPGAGRVEDRVQFAPALSARAGITLGEHFTPSVRALAILGSEGNYNAGGYHAAALFGELRIHSRKSGPPFQLFLAIGVGAGKLFYASTDCIECNPIKGNLSEYEQFTVGARLALMKRLWISFELGANLWHSLNRKGGERFIPPLTNGSLWGGIFVISFGIRT